MTTTTTSISQPIAVLDAMILCGVLRRNMLLSLAEDDLFQPRWSARILDETQKAIRQMTKGEIDGSQQRLDIETTFPNALVTDYEVHEDTLTLPDPDDVHVLAAAIEARAGIIVTENLKDFPQKALQPHKIKALSADEFIADMIKLHPDEAILALRSMREDFKNPPLDAAELISKAKAQGLTQTSVYMSQYKTQL